MDWFSAPDYWLSRLVVERGVALVYLLAFLNAWNQFRPLLGERGLLPVPAFLDRSSFARTPSLFHLGYSDRRLMAVAGAGVALSVAELAALPERAPVWVPLLSWFALWVLYLSIVNVGQVFYGFGWESLLLESGFVVMLLGSFDTLTPWPVIVMLRWLLFRVEFGAGLIKLRGDPCWRDLTCLQYHHETQPMPNALSRRFHHLPPAFHRIEVLGNHAAQLLAPFGLFAPQPVAGVAAAAMVLTQGWLVLSGNFAWLNLLTIVLAFAAIDDSWLHRVLPLSPPQHISAAPHWYAAVVLAVAAVVAALSWWPVRNMASRGQHMNASFNTLHLVNTYGAFGSITRVRHEVVIEGTAATASEPSAHWRAYEFRGKPGDPARRPPQVAPYHLRLDWLMWFAALSPRYARAWLPALAVRLLENDAPTLRLLRHNPFPGTPPRQVRAVLYRYRFTTRDEHRRTGATWVRTPVGTYLAPVSLEAATR